ncbi:hypothetical protein Ciccas_002108 [Cichlidogyrus casuarinus]|uniref:non-specific serine/threonine protein kinase n=1 Tax=Cichlidogyrus casuarinus TaxID=1844966 RepID=A0ABD2QIF8_9PLAT
MIQNHLSQYELEKELLNPKSLCFIENLLDLVVSLVEDCSYPAAKNSKAVQRFLKRFNQVAKLVDSARTTIDDFDIIKVIGEGGFGRVQLVRNKHNRRVFAMKTMSKEHLIESIQPGYWEERDIMDKECVYLCMDYMPGGDLYHWIEEYDTLTEEQTRFYLAETLMAVECLHSMNFIHCDLKPDNLLLDAKGHLKLADFGSCVSVDPKTGTFHCTHSTGTPDYISPEVLNCQSKPGEIGPQCDWWALGIICYEMLFGEPAFYGEALVETYTRILTSEKSLKFPDDVDFSKESESLIRGVLRENPSDRLSCADLKNHAFFAGIDWLNLRNTRAPIQPVVNSEVDTSNINFNDDDSPLRFNQDSGIGSKLPRIKGAFSQKKQPPSYFTGMHLSFAGYTFKRDKIPFAGTSMNTTQVVAEDLAVCKLESLEKIVEDRENLLSQLKKENGNLGSKLVTTEAKLVDTQKMLQQRDSELEAKRQELIRAYKKGGDDSPEDEVEDINSLKMLHKEAIDFLQQQISSLESHNLKMAEELVELRKEKEELLTDYQTTLTTKDCSLRSLAESGDKERRALQLEVTALKETVNARNLELDSVKAQRDEITNKCASLETNVTQMTERITTLTKDKDLLTIKLDSSVKKLVQVTQQGGFPAQVATMKPQSRFRGLGSGATNSAEYYALEKKHKNLEAKFNEFVEHSSCNSDQLKHELDEKTHLLAEMMETNRALSDDLAQKTAILAQLYDRFDNMPTAFEDQNVAPAIAPKTSHVSQLETVVDFISKGKGRNKIVWSPKFAVIKPHILTVYNSRVEKEASAKPILELHLNQVLHARKASELDVHHAKKEDVPRVIQIIYEAAVSAAQQQPQFHSGLSITQIDNHTTVLSHGTSDTSLDVSKAPAPDQISLQSCTSLSSGKLITWQALQDKENPEMLSSAEQNSAAVNAKAKNLYRSMRSNRAASSLSMVFRSNSKSSLAVHDATRRISQDSAYSEKGPDSNTCSDMANPHSCSDPAVDKAPVESNDQLQETELETDLDHIPPESNDGSSSVYVHDL